MSNKELRVFTYGCSVTQHIWPTWADIVLHSARISGYSVFNAGLSGIGNTGIKRSVIQTHEKYRITDKDLLLVMWSSFLREDRLTNFNSHLSPNKQRLEIMKENLTRTDQISKYRAYAYYRSKIGVRHTQSGNVLNSPFYTKEFIRDYFNVEHYIINSISEISIVRKAFNLLFEGHFSIGEGLTEASELSTPLGDREGESEYTMLMDNLMLPNHWSIGTNYKENSPYVPYYACDGHPVPAEALEYVMKVIEPKLPFPIASQTIDWINIWNDLLIEQIRLHSEGIHLNKHHWAPTFVANMHRYNATNGVKTSKDVWGGIRGDEERIDVESIVQTFIGNSAEKY